MRGNMSYGQVTLTTATSLVIAANPKRISFVVENLGTPRLFLGLDAALTTATGGVVLITNGSYTDEANDAGKCWLGGVYGVVESTTNVTTKASYLEVER